ncbi:MAG: PEP-CTERM sorting domain-containing protein [bacterium]|nr:PEP-CTERM sorting domain-containing protein [bacterium]
MKTGFGLALTVALLTGGAASAGVIVTVEETGGDVVMTGGGTLDLSLATGGLVDSFFPVIADDMLFVGQSDPGQLFGLVNFAGPGFVGSGPYTSADSWTGDIIGILTGGHGGGGALAVPFGYVSGDPLGPSTATYTGETFASLGLTEGSYTWTWDTAVRSDDFFTLDIIPEPTALSLLALGGMAMIRRRR